ncbi:hypothetical protein MM182_00175 [Aeromonas sp. MR19]|uniref:hypothetical protein n=1 Tax=Aeromonas sp. MR19 TaxID=2923421 RepID=UPI001F4A19F7|nr:hypothetical protein [Aeromonas sp. MR19]MCH7373811.1 hypothetical protein [Aeromonas sp. MR19]
MNSCNDEVIAVLEVSKTTWRIRRTFNYNTHFVGLDSYHLHKDKYSAPVVIVTESPHIEEFNNINIIDFTSGVPVNSRPVNGATGQNIMNHLLELLKQENITLETGRYPVIVINAIQEQCSLGVDTKLHRTKNFIADWPTKISILINRLSNIEPILTINACTVGDFYINNGESAFQQGKRNTFEMHFLKLIENEIGYKIHHNNTYQNVIEMYGSIDLAGMVMSVINNVYSPSYRIEKTTHPSFWSNTAPRFQRKNGNKFMLYK